MGFRNLNPFINLIFFISALVFTIAFRHPVFLAISFASAFCSSVYICGKKAGIFNLILVAFTMVWTLWYASYHHFGVTVLGRNSVGNAITLESILYGLVLGITGMTVVMWFECIHAIMTSDKWIYMFGRVSPSLATGTALAFRFVPRIKESFKRFDRAASAFGKGSRQGNLPERAGHVIRLISMLINSGMEALITAGQSMRSRGGDLKKRSAYALYRFDNRDRVLIVFMAIAFTAFSCGAILDQVNITYNPAIIMNRITPLSFIFYGLYLIYMMMPLWMEAYHEKTIDSSLRSFYGHDMPGGPS